MRLNVRKVQKSRSSYADQPWLLERETLLSLPVPFLIALRAITQDKSSVPHLLLVPSKALLTKPDPDPCSSLLSSPESEKGQFYLTSVLFSSLSL